MKENPHSTSSDVFAIDLVVPMPPDHVEFAFANQPSQRSSVDEALADMEIIEAPQEESSDLVPDFWSLVVILINAFLLNFTYYVIFPTVHKYVFSLGGTNTVVGVVLGVMAIVGSAMQVPALIWTRYSFKAPLVSSVVARLVPFICLFTSMPN